MEILEGVLDLLGPPDPLDHLEKAQLEILAPLALLDQLELLELLELPDRAGSQGLKVVMDLLEQQEKLGFQA
jgi:hypothetical protein